MARKLVAVIVLGAVGVGALVYGMGGLGASATSATQYLTAPATVGDVAQDVAATGTIAPTSRTAAAFGTEPWDVDEVTEAPVAEATYPVLEVAVGVGDTVAAGDALATADTAELRDQLAQARNDLTSARLSLRSANEQLDDADSSDLKRQARIGRLAALNARDAAQAKVDDLREQIAAATLTAPVAGVVSEVSLVVGRDAPAGAGIVIDSTTFEITTDVVEDDVAAIAVGQPASVTLDAIDAEASGTVSAISPTAGADTGSGVVSYPVTVTIDDAPADARSGMSADVTITIASADGVLTVPASALRGRDGAYSVLVLGADGTEPVATAVGVGLVTETLAEITSGLTEGTAVVTGTASDLAGGTTAPTGGFGGGVAIPGSGPIIRQGGPGGGQGGPQP